MQSEKLPTGRYIFEWGGLIANAGGMTRAMLKRANVFIREGIRPTILLSARGMEQYDSVEYYQNNGYSLIEERDFVCMQEYFGNLMMNNANNHSAGHINEFDELPRDIRENITVYYKNGDVFAEEEKVSERFIKVKIYDSNGEYKYTEHYWEGKLCRRIYPNELEKGKKRYREKFYAPNGFCFLALENWYDDGKWSAKNVILLDENKKNVSKFKTLDKFREFFFCEYLKNCDEKEIFVFCDPFLDFYPGFQYMNIPNKKIYRIGVNHGVGLGGERKWYSRLNPRIENTIEKRFPPDVEAFVLLTKQAMGDFQKRLGRCNYMYNVPNTIAFPNEVGKFEGRDTNKIVFVGRLDEKTKQISHAIKAFAKASKQNEKLHFHLYGSGDDEKTYRTLIENLGIVDKAFLEGFTNNVNEVYQSAGVSIFTSDFEGFSLSLLEAMANACVPISYDFIYGPKDTIIDGINGMLVPKNDVDELAEKIIYLSNNPKLIEQMSVEAYKTVQKYNEDNYLKNWKTVLNSIVERYPYKNFIEDMIVVLRRIIILPNVHEKKIEMTISVVGSVPDIAQNDFIFSVRLYNSQNTDFTINECSVMTLENQKYDVKFIVPDRLEGEVSVCLEWDNTFLEKKLVL